MFSHSLYYVSSSSVGAVDNMTAIFFINFVGKWLVRVKSIEHWGLICYFIDLYIKFGDNVHNSVGVVPKTNDNKQSSIADHQHLKRIARRNYSITASSGSLHEQKDSILLPNIPLILYINIDKFKSRWRCQPNQSILILKFIEVNDIDWSHDIHSRNGETPVNQKERVLDEPV